MNDLENIQNHIYTIRGQRVMLDFDLASIYEVETKALNQAVKRNYKRFEGEEFMFQLTPEEWRMFKVDFFKQYPTENEAATNLRSQFVTANYIKKQRFFPYAFTEIGVAVIISADYELLTNLENKKYTNEIVGRYHLCKCIPSFYATNLEEFKQAYTSVKNLEGDFENCRVCMKYTEDEGAVSFRVIVPDEEVDFRRISSPIGAKISYSEVLKILSSEPEFKELMIMPFLNGLDVTIDSFMGDYNFFAVSRYKLGNRRVLVENNEQFYNLSKQFAIMTGLKGLYNIQLKGHNEEWYFLEVNTRMAGGIHKAISCGVNLPYLAYADAIGKDISDKAKELQEHFGDRQHLSQIETPIMLENDGLTARDLTAIDLILRG